jgi:hypothetical protein
MKKDSIFIWTTECCKALDTLIDIVLSNPSLQLPNPAKQFFLHRAVFLSSLDNRAHILQLQHTNTLQKWATTFSLKREGELFWYRDWLVVVDNLPLRRGVISLYHDSPTSAVSAHIQLMSTLVDK